MKLKSTTSEKVRPRVARFAAAVLLIAILMASCAPAPAPAAAPTAVPPAAVQPTAVPPTAVPPAPQPTAVPPTPAPAAQATAPDPAYYENEPVAVVPAGQSGLPMVTAAYNTVIRGGPGTNYVTYGAFMGSQTAQAVGISQDKTYYVISMPIAPGSIGWVPADYCVPSGTENLPTIVAPPPPPTVALVPPAANEPSATALTEIYVRNGPSPDFPAYGIATANKTARVIGKSVDGLYWVVRIDPAKVGVGYGWASAAYTKTANTDAVPVVATPTPPTAVVPPPVEFRPLRRLLAALWRRCWSRQRAQRPGNQLLCLRRCPGGASAPITGKSSDGFWWQVKIPTHYASAGLGWVSADWVYAYNTQSVPVVSAPPAPPQPTAPPSTAPRRPQAAASSSRSPRRMAPPSERTLASRRTWTVKNTGSETWAMGEFDVRYQGAINGEMLHQGGDIYDIQANVANGQELYDQHSHDVTAEPRHLRRDLGHHERHNPCTAPSILRSMSSN